MILIFNKITKLNLEELIVWFDNVHKIIQIITARFAKTPTVIISPEIAQESIAITKIRAIIMNSKTHIMGSNTKMDQANKNREG